MDTEYDAILHNWKPVQQVNGVRIGGLIYNDSEERFANGIWVTTGTIEGEPEEGAIVDTGRTRYYLAAPYSS